MEGIDILESLDATELSLVLGLVIPQKFKTPTFDKYDGTKCPTTYLIMYCRKMSASIDNDKLLIYCSRTVLRELLQNGTSNWIEHISDLGKGFLDPT